MTFNKASATVSRSSANHTTTMVPRSTLIFCAALLRTARGGEAGASPSCTANFANCYDSQCCTSNVAFGCFCKRGKVGLQNPKKKSTTRENTEGGARSRARHAGLNRFRHANR